MNIPNLLNNTFDAIAKSASGNDRNNTAHSMPISHSQSLPPVPASLLWNQQSGQWAVKFKDLTHGEKSVGIHSDSLGQIDRLSKEESLQGRKTVVETKHDDQRRSEATFKVLDTPIRLDTASFDQGEDIPFADFIAGYKPAPKPLFVALPAELSLDVLGHLSLSDKKTLRQTNKEWCSVITPGLTQLKIDRRFNPHELGQLLDKAPGKTGLNVKKITLSDANLRTNWVTQRAINRVTSWVTSLVVRNMVPVLQSHPHITEFDASNCFVLDDLALVDLKTVPHLEKLTLRNCNLGDNPFRHLQRGNDNAQPFPHLTHLDVSGCSQIQTIDNLQNLPALEHLNLYSCLNLNNLSALQSMQLKTLIATDVKALGQNMGHLRHMQSLTSLNMSNCLPPEVQLQELQHLTGLEQLDLSCARISPGVLQLLGSLHNLKELRMGTSELDTSALPHLGSLPGSLEKLDLGYLKSEDGSRGSLGRLGNLLNLTALNLENSQHGVAEDLAELQKLTRLEYLNISAWPDLTDQLVTDHILPLQNLTCLVVEYCGDLTETSIRRFTELPKLEILALNGCNYSGELYLELKRAIPNLVTGIETKVTRMP